MSAKELEGKVRELRQFLALIKEMESEAEALKDEIKAFMGDAESIQAGEYKVTWKIVKSSRVDTTALKKAMPDVAKLFTVDSVTRRFNIA